MRDYVYLVTEVTFDIDETLSDVEASELLDQFPSYWEATDPEDLVEELTAAYGWCIKSLDYVQVLADYTAEPQP